MLISNQPVEASREGFRGSDCSTKSNLIDSHGPCPPQCREVEVTGIHGVLSQPPTQHTLTLPVVYHGKVQTPESMDENLIHSLTTVV